MNLRAPAVALLLAACSSAPLGPPTVAEVSRPDEPHLTELRQLTFGGENAEAYWSFDGAQLSFQARHEGQGCDRIYRMAVDAPQPVRLSSGEGATTCAHFLPGGEEVIYASTHLGGAACPPRPDHSRGYVWALYDTYDIFRARAADGSGLTRLTTEPGYDAEGTVCSKDGSIVFTSVRDGDLELYRMDRDGKNVRRLTHEPGYDGGAFWNADCTKLVWRASRPTPGPALEEYQALLAKGLVRPSKLELYVSGPNGEDARQITYLDAASFAPFWVPGRNRVLFSTNYGDPKGREFDLWAIDADGTNLERITAAPGFDGFPMFSPDGRSLAFSSNRATAPGRTDTNVFVARWVDEPAEPREELAPRAADRVLADVRWLASPEREGRGIGSQGLVAAGEYVERRFADLGLVPAGDAGTYRQSFPVVVAQSLAPTSAVKLGARELPAGSWTALGFSASGVARGPLVLAGYGIEDDAVGRHDYAGLDVTGKVVVVRRFVPDAPAFASTAAQRRHGDLRQKAWLAREKGAAALVVVDLPETPTSAVADWQMPAEAPLPALRPEGVGDAGLPVVVVRRAELAPLLASLRGRKTPVAEVKVTLSPTTESVFTVLGKVAAGAPTRAPGTVVVGAHHDHLGLGGHGSMAPDKHEPHLGADDNASGVAAVLEIARELMARRSELTRDVLLVTFSAEEAGALGSTFLTRQLGDAGVKDLIAMVNLDMVGRMRDGRLSVLGTESAVEWPQHVGAACDRLRLRCAMGGDGFGASDHMPFYAAGAPVVHLFTGTHGDYHKPSDAAALINAAGLAQSAALAAELAHALASAPERLTYKVGAPDAPRGDMRSFNASLGTIPDYAGAPGQRGVLLAGVRPGGAAELGGMARGDLLVRLGRYEVGSVEDLMYALNGLHPGETVTAVVLREGKRLELEVTMQESKRR